MINTILWGLDSALIRNSVIELDKAKFIKIKKWFVSNSCIKEEFFKTLDFTECWFDKFLSFYSRNEIAFLSEELYKKIDDKIYMFMDMLARESYFTNFHVYEYRNVIIILASYFYKMLIDNKVDLVVFQDVPHGAPDTILYYLAKFSKVKTLILVPNTQFSGFNYIYDIDDYGIFKNVPDYNKEIEYVKIENKYEKELFYMREITIEEKINKKFAIIVDFSKWYNERKIILKSNVKKYKTFKNFLVTKAIKELTKYKEKTMYSENRSLIEEKDVNLDVNFIYFPLHLQPEMTTSALGGLYCDQLLAIEQLSEKIPNNWFIYAKENPKQDSYMRGSYFFKRLSLLKNVKYINKKYDTYKLMEKAKCVATITGTAGWEAITGGKNVVIFGKAWYKNFPGVYEFSDKISINEICDNKINHNTIEEVTTDYVKKIVNVIYLDDYLESVDNLDLKKNEFDFYIFLKFIVDKIEEDAGGQYV